MATEPQIRGYLFEALIKEMMKKYGYHIGEKTHLSGRGTAHQIDSYGEYPFITPFVYPIRLLAEAKWLKKDVDLPIVRNFLGVVKDVSENYFSKRKKDRYTDLGCIFSAAGFNGNAQNFAFAHGIYLFSVENDPIFNDLLKLLENLVYKLHGKKGIKKKALELIQNNVKIRNKIRNIGFYVGIFSGIYPVIITSPRDFLSCIESDYDELEGFTHGYNVEKNQVTLEIPEKFGGGIAFINLPPRLIKEQLDKAIKAFSRGERQRHFIDIPIIKKTGNRMYRRIYRIKTLKRNFY